MNTLTPQLALLTTGVGALMILFGLGRGLLDDRDPGRRCPSCGRLIQGRVCQTCTNGAR